MDYIGLGPFRFTQTKQNLSPFLGLQKYASILKELKTAVPIIAIGGITIQDVPELIETGVYGIAASGTITNDFNTINRFHNILQTAATQEQVWKPNKNA